MSTHLDEFEPVQRDAMQLLQRVLRRWAMNEPADVKVADPHALARGIADALQVVASDPAVLRECTRQLYIAFDLAPHDREKRAEVLATYHDDEGMAQWSLVATGWLMQLAAELASRPAPTRH